MENLYQTGSRHVERLVKKWRRHSGRSCLGLTALLTLAILHPKAINAEEIYRSPFSNDVSFKGFKGLNIMAPIDKSYKEAFINALKSAAGKDGEVILLNHDKEIQIHTSYAMHNFVTGSIIVLDDQTHLVRLDCTMTTSIKENGESAHIPIWSEIIIVRNKNNPSEAVSTLNESVKRLIAHFFATNPEAKGTAKFYINTVE